jgi:Glycosyl Hydrolase Family 88.
MGDEQRLAGQGCLSTRSDEGVELSDYCSLAARWPHRVCTADWRESHSRTSGWCQLYC